MNKSYKGYKNNHSAKNKKVINVSIVVPCCNVEKYLEQCLSSIVKQTLKEIEIICINDGSKDRTLDIINKFAAKDERIIVVDKPNSGYGDSMNIGFSKARGRYIGIVESDDFIEPEMFEKLYKTAREFDADVVKSNFWFYWSNPEKNELHEYFKKEECGFVICPHEYDGGSLYGRKPSIWSAIYKKEFIEQNNISFLPTPGASFQDTSFTFKVYSSAKKMVCLYDAFLHYRQDNENSSVNNADKKIEFVLKEYEEIERYINSSSYSKELYPIYATAFYDTCIWTYERCGIKKRMEFLKLASSIFKKIDKKIGIASLNFGDCWWKTNGMMRIAKDPFEYHIWRDVERYEQIGSEMTYEIPVTPLNNQLKKSDEVKPLFSIIIPVYNSEKYLTACLDSVIFQTFDDFEVICINDGSTDHSLSILEKYAKVDNRIKILNIENSGPANARNVGLNNATGKYILFLDSDDFYSQNCCETLNEKLMGCNDDIIMFGTELYPETPRASEWHYSVLTTKDSRFEKISQYELLTIPYLKVYSWRCCFKSSFIQKFKLRFKNDFKYGEDALFMTEAMLNLNGLTVISDKLYNYRHYNPDSLMNGINKNHEEFALQQNRILTEMLRLYKQYKLQPSKELLEYSFDFIYSSIAQCPEPNRTKNILSFVELMKKYKLDEFAQEASDNCKGFWNYCISVKKEYKAGKSISLKFKKCVRKLAPPSRQAFYDYSTQMVNCVREQQQLTSILQNRIHELQNELDEQKKCNQRIEWCVNELLKKYNDDKLWSMPQIIEKTDIIMKEFDVISDKNH